MKKKQIEVLFLGAFIGVLSFQTVSVGKCMPKENIDAAIDKITNKFSNCFCEISPHATFPVFTFKVTRAKQIYFEAVII